MDGSRAQKRAAINADDPTGTKYMDIVTNAMPAYHVRLADADLCVKRGAAPTTASWDCRPYRNDSNETCTVTLDTPAPIYVMVRGYAAASTFTLVGKSPRRVPCEWP